MSEQISWKDFLRWKSMQLQLKILKKQEIELRKKLCFSMFKERVGAFKVKQEYEGWKLEAESKTTHKLDKVQVAQIHGELTDEDRNALKYTPEIKLREYKKLPEDSLLHEAVTVVPASPTLKMEKIKK